MSSKQIAFIFITLMGVFMSTANASSPLYTFKVATIDGQTSTLDAYSGKVLLIVNTASGCGYTPQYKGLQALQVKYAAKGLVVLGFPSNDFGGQEPGTNAEIKKFCSTNYNITFPIFSKAPVSGKDIQPVFKWLTQDADSKLAGPVQWNFEKFIVGRDGQLKKRFKSSVAPDGADLVSVIESELSKK